jgi:hypothetical protein
MSGRIKHGFTNARRDAPVVCAACGKTAKRKMRGQRYCSARCRENGRGRIRQDTRAPATPLKSLNEISSLQRRKMRSSLFANAPLNVLGGGSFRWPETPRLDARTLENILSSEIGAAP